MKDIRLPSGGRLAALTGVTLLLGAAAAPIPSFTVLSNELRAFAGAGLAFWAADRLLAADKLGLRALFAETGARSLRARLLPALKTYALYLAVLLGGLFLVWGLLLAWGHFSGGGTAGADSFAAWTETGNARKAQRLAESGAGRRVWWLFWILVFAPVLEELFFRRLLYVRLRRSRGPALSGAVSSGVFALFHAPLPLLMLVTGLLGVFLCRLYEKTRDYGACVAMHALNNALALAIFWMMGRR